VRAPSARALLFLFPCGRLLAQPDRRAAELIEDLRSPDATAADRSATVEMGSRRCPPIQAPKDPEARVATPRLRPLGPGAERNAVPTMAEVPADSDDGVRLRA
jgi:hypothetical protein